MAKAMSDLLEGGMRLDESLTDEFKDDNVHALEYRGKFLLVLYKAENYAAIWELLE
jgi:hypothetical protein